MLAKIIELLDENLLLTLENVPAHAYGLAERVEADAAPVADDETPALYDDRYGLTFYHRVEQIRFEKSEGFGEKDGFTPVFLMRCVAAADFLRLPFDRYGLLLRFTRAFPTRVTADGFTARLRPVAAFTDAPTVVKRESQPDFPTVLALQYEIRVFSPLCPSECGFPPITISAKC